MSKKLKSLAIVLLHRMGELDKWIIANQDDRENDLLWNSRIRLEKLWKLLIDGKAPPNPGNK